MPLCLQNSSSFIVSRREDEALETRGILGRVFRPLSTTGFYFSPVCLLLGVGSCTGDSGSLLSMILFLHWVL